MYIVWRRDDGYVAASVKWMPAGWTQPSDGHKVTFEKLGEYENWHDAYLRIEQERAAQAAQQGIRERS